MQQPEIPHSRQPTIQFFETYVKTNAKELQGMRVYDLSAGSGFIANLFLQQGAVVFLYDLFPEQNIFCPTTCHFIDLQKPFPIESNSAELLICAETMEHLPNQHFFFQEAARILKPHGKLILTTPNVSSLRSRFSQFVGESEHYSSPLPNEFNAFTKWPQSEEGYFSKIFLSGILRLRLLAAIQGLSIGKVIKTKASSTSVWLLIFYPIIYYFSYKNYRQQVKLNPSGKKTLREIFELNTSLNILVSKHLIIEFDKK
jgi:SAM-dependent methyltransferase